MIIRTVPMILGVESTDGVFKRFFLNYHFFKSR